MKPLAGMMPFCSHLSLSGTSLGRSESALLGSPLSQLSVELT